tara:strand:+ start:83309 stop:84577 length:1269 start_codon:yes stop_codon:yes gene_type:complete
MRVGLVGKPNVGKSTSFSSLTSTPVDIADYPFTTIEPNIGVAWIPVPDPCPCHNISEEIITTKRQEDERGGSVCNPKSGSCVGFRRLVPVTMVDVAGLVPGANEGRGRGNQFLSDLSRCDALIQIIDASGSTDLDGNYSEGEASSPVQEFEFLIEEIELWLTSILKQGWSRGARKVQSGGDKALVEFVHQMISGLGGSEKDAIVGIKAAKSSGANDQPWTWGEETLRSISSAIRMSMFPIAVAINKVDKIGKMELQRILEYFRTLNITCMGTSSEAEFTLDKARGSGLVSYRSGDHPSSFTINQDIPVTPTQRKVLERIREKMSEIEGNGLVDLLSKVVFQDLSRIVAYPVADEGKWVDTENRILPDAIILPEGSTARDLAYGIHTDLGSGFIRASNALSGRSIGGESLISMSDVIKIHAKT